MILKIYKFRVKKKLKILKKELKALEDKYNNIKFYSQSEKAHVWVKIQKYLFAIEQLKSI